jgi:TonB family protein
MRIEEFKEEEKLTSTNIPTPKRTPKAKSSKQPAVAKQSTKATTTENESEVLVPKATITEITETEFGDDGIPLPEIVDAEIPMFSTVTTETLDTGASSASGSSAEPERTANLQQMARSELVEETVEENSLRTVARPTPDQIRSVSNLRQRPGNPLPSYSDFERLRRHEGQVTYLAYVTAEGRLKDFILTESSGHSNLDQKTLSSLKGWRFYPGQEGWVEIPQVWVLSGQPEELPSQLRR